MEPTMGDCTIRAAGEGLGHGRPRKISKVSG